MTDESKNNPLTVNHSIAKEFKKLQETVNPLAKTIAETTVKVPKVPQMDLVEPPLRLPSVLVDQNLASEFYKRLKKGYRILTRH